MRITHACTYTHTNIYIYVERRNSHSWQTSDWGQQFHLVAGLCNKTYIRQYLAWPCCVATVWPDRAMLLYSVFLYFSLFAWRLYLLWKDSCTGVFSSGEIWPALSRRFFHPFSSFCSVFGKYIVILFKLLLKQLTTPEHVERNYRIFKGYERVLWDRFIAERFVPCVPFVWETVTNVRTLFGNAPLEFYNIIL